MTISNKDKDQLIQFRLNQAYDTIKVIELLINNDQYAAAVNRIYYSIFYSLLALGLKYDFKTSKHLQLAGSFSKAYVKRTLAGWRELDL